MTIEEVMDIIADKYIDRTDYKTQKSGWNDWIKFYHPTKDDIMARMKEVAELYAENFKKENITLKIENSVFSEKFSNIDFSSFANKTGLDGYNEFLLKLFVEMSFKIGVSVFRELKLENQIMAKVADDATGEKFEILFKKLKDETL